MLTSMNCILRLSPPEENNLLSHDESEENGITLRPELGRALARFNQVITEFVGSAGTGAPSSGSFSSQGPADPSTLGSLINF